MLLRNKSQISPQHRRTCVRALPLKLVWVCMRSSVDFPTSVFSWLFNPATRRTIQTLSSIRYTKCFGCHCKDQKPLTFFWSIDKISFQLKSENLREPVCFIIYLNRTRMSLMNEIDFFDSSLWIPTRENLSLLRWITLYGWFLPTISLSFS